MKNNVLFQDIESAIKMERNGLKSCGDKSRHINIRYFFIKDILDNENISVEHCGTDMMIADFMTKPLQGAKFRLFRNVIMGAAPFLVEERVGNSVHTSTGATSARSVGGTSMCKDRSTYADIVRIDRRDNICSHSLNAH